MAGNLGHDDSSLPYVGRSYSTSSDHQPLTNEEYNRKLLAIRASRWADFFPDELVIQEKTISVVKREFMVSYVQTIPVKDIGRVVYVDIPFFAGLEILGKNTAHDLKISGLKKVDALKAKEVLEGLMLEDLNATELPHWIHPEEADGALGHQYDPAWDVNRRRGDYN